LPRLCLALSGRRCTLYGLDRGSVGAAHYRHVPSLIVTILNGTGFSREPLHYIGRSRLVRVLGTSVPSMGVARPRTADSSHRTRSYDRLDGLLRIATLRSRNGWTGFEPRRRYSAPFHPTLNCSSRSRTRQGKTFLFSAPFTVKTEAVGTSERTTKVQLIVGVLTFKTKGCVVRMGCVAALRTQPTDRSDVHRCSLIVIARLPLWQPSGSVG